MTLPAPGERWRHWKGYEMTVVALAYEESGGTALVVYRSDATHVVWSRRLSDFLGMVKQMDAPAVPRFVRITDD